MIWPSDGPTQALSRCIQQISDWMCWHLLQLNKGNTEIIVCEAKEEQLKISAQLQLLMWKITNQPTCVPLFYLFYYVFIFCFILLF